MCSANWIPWCLFFGTRRVGLHWSGEAWDQSHWWWTFQREIWENPSTYGRQGCSHMKEMLEVGMIHPRQRLWCNTVNWYARKMEVYVSAWTFINWIQGPRKTLTHFHGYRKQSRAYLVQVLFLLGLKGRVLAYLYGWGLQVIHCFYCGEHRILWMWTYAAWAV